MLILDPGADIELCGASHARDCSPKSMTNLKANCKDDVNENTKPRCRI